MRCRDHRLEFREEFSLFSLFNTFNLSNLSNPSSLFNPFNPEFSLLGPHSSLEWHLHSHPAPRATSI